jgi:CDP-diacylglycerol--glycerol-3-phosphate 3-phosphatidyltransferase
MNRLKANIPNLLSASRLFLIVPFYMAMAHSSYFWIIVLTAVIISTDYFDGFLARRFGVVSDFGKILDPLADKICTAVAALALVRFRDFPLWLLIAIIARDAVILLAGLIIVKARRIVPISNIIGRLTMGVTTACFVFYMFDIGPLKGPVSYLALSIMVLSLISYGIGNMEISRRGPAKHKIDE